MCSKMYNYFQIISIILFNLLHLSDQKRNNSCFSIAKMSGTNIDLSTDEQLDDIRDGDKSVYFMSSIILIKIKLAI